LSKLRKPLFSLDAVFKLVFHSRESTE